MDKNLKSAWRLILAAALLAGSFGQVNVGAASAAELQYDIHFYQPERPVEGASWVEIPRNTDGTVNVSREFRVGIPDSRTGWDRVVIKIKSLFDTEYEYQRYSYKEIPPYVSEVFVLPAGDWEISSWLTYYNPFDEIIVDRVTLHVSQTLPEYAAPLNAFKFGCSVYDGRMADQVVWSFPDGHSPKVTTRGSYEVNGWPLDPDGYGWPVLIEKGIATGQPISYTWSITASEGITEGTSVIEFSTWFILSKVFGDPEDWIYDNSRVQWHSERQETNVTLVRPRCDPPPTYQIRLYEPGEDGPEIPRTTGGSFVVSDGFAVGFNEVGGQVGWEIGREGESKPFLKGDAKAPPYRDQVDTLQPGLYWLKAVRGDMTVAETVQLIVQAPPELPVMIFLPVILK